jgi:hypothetical protein
MDTRARIQKGWGSVLGVGVQLGLAKRVARDNGYAVLQCEPHVALALLGVNHLLAALRQHLLRDATNQDHDTLALPQDLGNKHPQVNAHQARHSL